MTIIGEEMLERVARAISVPQHHTTWDTLTWQEKDLFYMQADYAIKAMSSSPEAVTVMREALERARVFIRELATTDTIIMADTLEAEAAKIDAALSKVTVVP